MTDIPPNAVEAARHLCQEARVVLTSLRGGPPIVARGEMAAELMDLRSIVKAVLSEVVSNTNNANNIYPDREIMNMQSVDESIPFRRFPEPPVPTVVPPSSPPPTAETDANQPEELGEGAVLVEPVSEPQQKIDIPPGTPPTGRRQQHTPSTPGPDQHPPQTWSEDVGPFARPFLAVIVDPRAAGPHTLVALRSLFRLVEQGSLLQPDSFTRSTMVNAHTTHPYTVLFEALTKGVLSCKFEQTDAGADEAVEMAIADLLALLVKKNQRSIQPDTLMDAFNTVFVTRNTFVHSPALCYHFEDVLTEMVSSVFSDFHPAATHILEFLVNQLLHTPLVGGDVVDEAMREAQMAHDATRLLCLRLVNCTLRTGWNNDHLVQLGGELDADPSKPMQSSTESLNSMEHEKKKFMQEKDEKELLRIIRDDLCLALLMTGQAIWTNQDGTNNISAGLISLDVLSEICNNLSTLWHTIPLRKHLVEQFETIFTGFYQRALVLLRKRTHPVDSVTFNADLVFDAEVEVILESLVDLMCLHDFRHSIADGDGGSLETLFATYDCHLGRSDVASGLMVDLCRCCGGNINEDGEVVAAPGANVEIPKPSPPVRQSSSLGDMSLAGDMMRPVPPHLKEVCAQALMGAMKCLFRDDKASKETLMKRSQRELTIMLSGEELQRDPCNNESEGKPAESESKNGDNDHFLRNIKSKKRLMRKAALLFNEKSSTGLKFLVSAGLFVDPPTPLMVAEFLRNGIVVGLSKYAVGAYLGEAGKSAEPGKSRPDFERDWFHKEVLKCYCSLFKFENQSLIDGLRMFLSSFRLPGEAQQIDRILQAFSDSCGSVCEESTKGRLKLFSTDPTRASDGAYLLSFSIIMLNTDLHNPNIREDRKMKLEDFIRNNTDYGSDITDKGKEFPREFLESIYESIRDEEIRTEGEGADGCMTIERWKDVLRSSSPVEENGNTPSAHDAEDLTELVLEHVWIPIMSAIGAFWGVARAEDAMFDANPGVSSPTSNPKKGSMLGVQGARLGMDMAVEMLEGVLHLRRIDIFRRIFACVCKYTGLVGEYVASASERADAFSNSLEAQSGLIVAIRIARTASDDIGINGWKLVWQMLFELRDLRMLGAAMDGGEFLRQNLLKESEPDLLTSEGRRRWNLWLLKGDLGAQRPQRGSSGVTSVLGAFGRALFGSDDDGYGSEAGEESGSAIFNLEPTRHGKENFLIWNEHASSDDENGPTQGIADNDGAGSPINHHISRSIGAQFEFDLIQENVVVNQQTEMPVTGLESLEETRSRTLSPRARVRQRLARACDFYGIISESRFMTVDGIVCMVQSLLDVIDSQSKEPEPGEDRGLEKAVDLLDLRLPVPPAGRFPLSPASSTFAEVLVCEIALKNKDRLGSLWPSVLEPHYSSRLSSISAAVADRSEGRRIIIGSSVEKCLTGLLRLCACATSKDVADDILGMWSRLIPPVNELPEHSLMSILDKQVGGGLWRIVNNVDGFSKLGEAGWAGLLLLATWCAERGGQLPPLDVDGMTGEATLAEDDPALQGYRSLHLMLNTEEVRIIMPYSVVESVHAIIASGERRRCSQLSIAGLDLLQNFLEHRGNHILELQSEKKIGDDAVDEFYTACWKRSLEIMATAAESCALSVSYCCCGRYGSYLPLKYLYSV